MTHGSRWYTSPSTMTPLPAPPTRRHASGSADPPMFRSYRYVVLGSSMAAEPGIMPRMSRVMTRGRGDAR
jgi:hypothetical protein